MKKLCIALLLFVLPPISRNFIIERYCVSVVFQNQKLYQEYMTAYCLYKLIGDFVEDTDIESIFITRDL